MSAARTRWGRRGPHYRRRRPLPALILLGVLVVVSGFVWTNIFSGIEDIETATRCNPPSPPTTAPDEAGGAAESVQPGEPLPRTALNQTSPVPQQEVQVRVLNGNGESRQASLVSDELASLGFVPGEAGNDPVYPNYDLNCHGQIRFGGPGAGAARTLSLVAPCAQLVRDDRQDATVDLALGSKFDDVKTTVEAKRVLQDLKAWVPDAEQEGDAQQAANPPRIDNELLNKARDVYC